MFTYIWHVLVYEYRKKQFSITLQEREEIIAALKDENNRLLSKISCIHEPDHDDVINTDNARAAQ